jgi:hypothetical protein
MMLYLVATMNRLNVDTHTFFRMAHVWAFQKDPQIHDDVAQYQLHGVVPKYVVSYLKYIQGET